MAEVQGPHRGGTLDALRRIWDDPQSKSALTSSLLSLLTTLASVMVYLGWISEGQAAFFVPAILTATMSIVGVVVLIVYKTSQVSPEAMIRAINRDPDNGVKVVPAEAPVQQVDAPIK